MQPIVPIGCRHQGNQAFLKDRALSGKRTHLLLAVQTVGSFF